MVAWEYCRLYPQRALLRRFTAHGVIEEQLASVATTFYRLGQEGWELVGVQGTSQTTGEGVEVREVLTFKRASPPVP